MSAVKCKICGGTLTVAADELVAVCEYCGTKQTIPSLNNQKKVELFDRANQLRMQCDFDRAMIVYENIISEFKEEAEAFWGLLLCRYGVEYVDDSYTNRKIPTMHRSSFSNILDDADYQAVLQYASGDARLLYEIEANQLEELRKQILGVSSKEQPYDIFICYKETDERGRRTLDSVLAQDIYNALTEAGYRVFFSRVSLEDKLGQEYEPYIFAALHSAKVMLAIGSNSMHYQGVWVKNEWSRFLKLIENGERKTLIPCYKNISPYELPEEFQKLQAQDLGEVGAIQDLLRGIQKIIPTKKRDGGNLYEQGAFPIDKILIRAGMALEDGDWKAANEYYDRALNVEAECAEAYLGKFLADVKCRNTDELIEQRVKNMQLTEQMEKSIDFIEPKWKKSFVEKHIIKGYLEAEELYALFPESFKYNSVISSREEKMNKEKEFFHDNKNYLRAIRFADLQLSNKLQEMEQIIYTQLEKRINEMEEKEQQFLDENKRKYEKLKQEAVDKVEALHETSIQRIEKDYNEALELYKKATVASDYQKVERIFMGFRGYKDSVQMIKNCQESEERWRQEVVEKNRAEHMIANKRETKAKKIIAICIVACMVVIGLMVWLIVPLCHIAKGKAKYKTQNYEVAAECYLAAGEFGNAIEKSNECFYLAGKQYLEDGNIVKAAMMFGKAGDYKDAKEQSGILWDEIASRGTIAVEENAILSIRMDGTVQYIVDANEYSDVDVDNWESIIDITAGEGFVVGLKSDGTLECIEDNGYSFIDIANWEGIVSVSAAGNHLVGLKTDGTVILSGRGYDNEKNVNSWEEIVSVSAGESHVVGLKSDGTVVAVGDNIFRECDVSEWTDIVDIVAGKQYTVGVKKDGTVVITGESRFAKEYDVSAWKDIVMVTVAEELLVGLKSDGTIVTTGVQSYGEGMVTDWTNIVFVETDNHQTVGLKSDGTICYAGIHNSNWGNLDVSELENWDRIRID